MGFAPAGPARDAVPIGSGPIGRTCDPCLRRAVLYPAELRAHADTGDYSGSLPAVRQDCSTRPWVSPLRDQRITLSRSVPDRSVEPATPAFGGQYSIQLSYGRMQTMEIIAVLFLPCGRIIQPIQWHERFFSLPRGRGKAGVGVTQLRKPTPFCSRYRQMPASSTTNSKMMANAGSSGTSETPSMP